MTSIAIASPATDAETARGDAIARQVVYRTRGRGHGPITRLMSPSDLGEHLKPFVFLDIFDANMSQMTAAGVVHPHSGIATVSVITEGDVHYDDPEAGQGHIAYGGVEWMRAGGGVWHGKELSSGRSERVRGFQLWLALPAELELSPVDSQYIEASKMSQVGPAHVIIGTHEGVTSPVRAPAGITYLLVTLAPGERWTYVPPAGHSAGWLALSHGSTVGGITGSAGEMLVLSEGEEPVELQGGPAGASFVLGSAIPHPHDLHLGYYSVHATAEGLVTGERNIALLREKLEGLGDRRRSSGATPIYRG